MKRLLILIISLSLLLFAAQCSNSGEGKDDGGKQKSSEKADKNDKQRAGKKENQGEEDKDEKKTDAIPVQVIAPAVGDISSFLLFSSNIDSEKVVDIYPMTYGIIRKIYFDEGQHVKKDAVLALLDDREALINEQKAGINYRNLQSEFARKKELHERNMLSKEEFERFKFNLETAQLDWKQKKLMLSYTRITTPISGVVTMRHIKEGNKINTSQLAFSVVEDKEKIAVVNIPEQEKNALFLKQKAVVFSGSQQVPGSVKRISPAIDPESGTFKVTVDVSDKEGIFAVGQFVNVKIIKKVHKDAILVTKDAIVYEGGKVFVFVVNKENKAMKKSVKLGFEEGNRVEVLEGLDPNEQVVTAGKSSLQNDTLVKIVKPVIG
ncbi:MAG: efflux RND transporter periplasmic adaptor subunit [bacterium]|nr:efflux RND transporter periplasmic adaptor subunit [bacterium]